MVRRVINLVYKEVRGLHQAAYVLALFAFGSQLLALIRDRLLAHQFGAGSDLDVYYAAFRIPDLLYVLFASTLSVYVLIPFVTNRLEKKNEQAGSGAALLSQVFSIFLVVYVSLAGVLFLLTPTIVHWLFPGLVAEQELLVTLMRILLLQPLFLGISSLFGVVTQLGHRFVLYAISPLIYNVGIIFGIVVFYPLIGLPGLVWGVVAGAVGHMAVQIPLVRKNELSFSLTQNFDWLLLRSVLKVSIPRATTLAMHQVVLLVFVGVASLMAVGSVAVFQFAYNLQSVPLAIVGASYSIAAFPTMARLHSANDMKEFCRHITVAMRHIMFWSLPIIALVIVLRAQLVRVILGSGEFDWADTKLVAAVLALLVISLVAQGISLLLVRAFYAGGYTKEPFYVTLFSSLLAVGLVLLLYSTYTADSAVAIWFAAIMRLETVPGSEVLLLAVAYSTAFLIQATALVVVGARKFSIPVSWLPRHVLHTCAAALVGGLTSYTILNFVVEGINQERFLGILIQGVLAGIGGLIGVIGTYYVLKTPELTEIHQSFKKKLFTTDIVASQEDMI